MEGFIAFLFLVAGALTGYYDLLPDFVLNSDMELYALWILLAAVGLSVGSDKSSLDKLRRIDAKVILVPISVVVGSIVGGYVSSLFLPGVSGREGMAVSAGFGYYSLSSILISELHSEQLGAVALMSNVIREVITLLFPALIAYLFGKVAVISSGGATAMDTTMPIVIKYCGKEYAVIALFSGLVLTIVTPILITFIFSF